MEEHVADIALMLGESAEVTHSLPHFCEVGSPRAGKVRALHWLADRNGLGPSDFITFGDGLGDLEMVRWAGRGYAVGDAHPEVMASAYRHIPGPDSEGVAEELEWLSGNGMLRVPV